MSEKHVPAFGAFLRRAGKYPSEKRFRGVGAGPVGAGAEVFVSSEEEMQ